VDDRRRFGIRTERHRLANVHRSSARIEAQALKRGPLHVDRVVHLTFPEQGGATVAGAVSAPNVLR